MLNLGQTFPNFTASSTIGVLNLFDYLGSSWGMLVSHPADFTPVCTTELARLAQLAKPLEERNVKTVCLSVDSLPDHESWVGDIKQVSGCQVPFPLVADEKGDIAASLGLLDAAVDKRVTVRGVFILDPEKKIKAVVCYPTSTGRNFDEILRLIDSLQLTAARPDIVTPVDWKAGGDLIVKPGSEIEGSTSVQLPSGKDYLRYVKQ